MNFLVTGACGFIGSVLCARLSELGHDVVAVDNGSRGRNDVSTLPHVTYLETDFLSPQAVEAMKAVDLQVVIHLAAKTGSLQYPVSVLRDENAHRAVALFRLAQALGIDLFIFPTTSLALGVPDSSYVISKEEAITQLLDAYHAWGTRPATELLLLRFFNVAGAHRRFTERRLNEVHILPRLFTCYHDQETFLINGCDYPTQDGSPSRDFIHVTDVCDFLAYKAQRILAGDVHNPVDIVHIGRGEPVTVFQLIEIMNRLGYGPFEWRRGPRRAFDCGELRCPQEAVEALNAWRPLRTIEQIVKDEIEAMAFWAQLEALHVPA